MKTSTKRTAKVVVALVAAIFTILALMFLCVPAHTAGDSEAVATTIVSTLATEETTFLETTTTTTKTTTSTNESSTTSTKLNTTTTTTKNTTAPRQETAASKTTVRETTQATTATTTTTVVTTSVVTEVYVVYKPSTHYIHLNTCRWYNSDCYRIENTEGIEARKCSECNPDMEIILEYVEPVTTTPVNSTSPIEYGDLTEWDITLLRRIVSSEYGADWTPVEEKAKIVASVMNMVESDDPYYPDDILGVLNKTCTPWGFYPYKDYYMSDSIIAAVDYYFANKDTVFANWYCTSWWGDGKYNHFYYYQNGVRVYQ